MGRVSTSSQSGREAFERAVVRGNELLREGNVAEAQQAFRAALQHDPENVRALALLGLAYFRGNDYEEARPIYEELCSLLPDDPANHLNLGLVRLKLGDTAAAIDALEESRRLDPSQGRAVNYLGLAYARAGRYGDAYEAFLIAGQEELASEIEPNLREDERAEVLRRLSVGTSAASGRLATGPRVRAPDSTAPPLRATRRSIPMIAPATPSGKFVASAPEGSAASAAAAGGPATAPAAAAPAAAAASPATPAAPSSPTGDAGAITRAVAVASPASAGRDAATRVSTGNTAPMALSALAMHSLVRPGDGDHPFEVSASGALLVRVSERMFCRLTGVYATGGQLDFEPAHRRSRGANTEDRFDHGGDAMSVVYGEGYLVAFPERGRFTAVYLDDDILYLREEKVFAFTQTLRWENGNIPGLRGKLPVVQFRGDGAVAFRTTKVVTPIKLPAGGAMYVDTGALIGWIGRVIPRAVMPAEGGPMAEVCVECTGEGVVLVEVGAAIGAGVDGGAAAPAP